MATALSIVQRFFPQVEKVVDGTKDITIHISKEGAKKATRKNHNHCALAEACKEQEAADGVIVSIRTVYVIKGKRAFRYHNLESTSREIVSFDREAGFEPGDYRLKPPSRKLGESPSGKGHGPQNRPDGNRAPNHVTTNIRTSLGHGGVI